MNITQYLKNPIGKGSAFFPIKDVARKMEERYHMNKSNIRCKIYNIRGRLFFHIKVPSNIEGIYYDVVINFIDTNSGGNSILDMDFKVFSNCPSFVYTYAYAYNEKGMVLKEIQQKLIRESIKETPDVRNPFKVTGYEYSVYLALRYIIDSHYINVDKVKAKAAKTMSLAPLMSNIQNFDALMKRRVAKEKIFREQKRKERDKIKKNALKEKKFTTVQKSPEDKPTVSNLNTTNKTNTVKKIKKVGKIKKR